MGSQEWPVRVGTLWKARGKAMKQTAASGDRDDEGKEAVGKGIATGCKETTLTDQQVGVNPYCNQSQPKIQLQNTTSIIDHEA